MIKILWIDDEAKSEQVNSIVEILRDYNIEPILFDNYEDGINFFKSNFNSLGLIVVDLIMPFKSRYNNIDTNGGSKTGMRVIQDLRYINKDVPIIIRSIKRKSSISQEEMEKLKISSFVEKDDPIMKFVESIKKYAK